MKIHWVGSDGDVCTSASEGPGLVLGDLTREPNHVKDERLRVISPGPIVISSRAKIYGTL